MALPIETSIVVAVGVAVGAFIVYRVVKTVRGDSACSCGCGCAGAVHLSSKQQKNHEKRVQFTVKNMHCGKCEDTVKHALGLIDGVLEVTANYKNGQVVVIYQDDQVPELARAKLDEIGFAVQEMQLR